MTQQHYLVYLDEFGHIGPYLSHTHPQYNTHPVFGMAGIVMPVSEVRQFSTFFFKLKNRLLQWEIQQAQNEAQANSTDFHVAKWEKKGSSLYTVTNIEKYRELRSATFRLLNHLKRINAFVIYVGIEKIRDVEKHDANKLYQSIFREIIKRLDQHCEVEQAIFQLLLDESENKNYERLIETAALQMFGNDPKKYLIEPPVQLKSHLYQTMQAADWMCGLISRLTQYECEPEAFAKNECVAKYFKTRVEAVSLRSGIRKLS